MEQPKDSLNNGGPSILIEQRDKADAGGGNASKNGNKVCSIRFTLRGTISERLIRPDLQILKGSTHRTHRVFISSTFSSRPVLQLTVTEAFLHVCLKTAKMINFYEFLGVHNFKC